MPKRTGEAFTATAPAGGSSLRTTAGTFIAQGGEGEVYDDATRPDHVLKLLHIPSAEVERKIRAMLASAPTEQVARDPDNGNEIIQIAWPQDILTTSSGAFVGYSMRRLDSVRTVELLAWFNPRSRSMNNLAQSDRTRLYLAANLASVTDYVHCAGHAVVDFKPQNILAYREHGYVSMIDCDGYRIRSGADVFPSAVATPNFTAPEHQTLFKPELMDELQDRFGLAVMIFMMLDNGRHPSGGKSNTLPTELAPRIAARAFFINPASGLQPPNGTHLPFFRDDTLDLFQRAFLGPADQRPTSADWKAHCVDLAVNAQPCSANPDHFHHGKGCPWCTSAPPPLQRRAPRPAPAVAPTARPSGSVPRPAPAAAPTARPPGPAPHPVPGTIPGPVPQTIATLLLALFGRLFGAGALRVVQRWAGLALGLRRDALRVVRRWAGLGLGLRRGALRVAQSWAGLALGLMRGALRVVQRWAGLALGLRRGALRVVRRWAGLGLGLQRGVLRVVRGLARLVQGVLRIAVGAAVVVGIALVVERPSVIPSELPIQPQNPEEDVTPTTTRTPSPTAPVVVRPTPAPPSAAPVALTVTPPSFALPTIAASLPGMPWADCAECPELMTIPAGAFLMGTPFSEIGRANDEGPLTPVTILRAFAIGRYEISFAEWDACVAASGCAHRPDDWGWGRGTRPVIDVSWNDTRDYVAWLSRETGHIYRLPTEAEWEYAARAPSDKGPSAPFATGVRLASTDANFGLGLLSAGGTSGQQRETVPRDRFAAQNAFGLHNVYGNVWEWVQDCKTDGYQGRAAGGGAAAMSDCSKRGIRGGSWANSMSDLRAGNRNFGAPSARTSTTGFRIVREIDR